jgi:hypothetical protein
MSCPHYNIDRQGYCIFCGVKVESAETPHVNWNDPIDPFEMAKAIKEKAENDKNKDSPPKKDIPIDNSNKPVEVDNPVKYLPLTICPKCQKISMFYNQNLDIYECLNLKCKSRSKSINGINDILEVPLYNNDTNKSLAIIPTKPDKQTTNIPKPKLNNEQGIIKYPPTIKQPIKRSNHNGYILLILILVLITILILIKWDTSRHENINNTNTTPIPTPTYSITPNPDITYTTISPIRVSTITPTLTMPIIKITPRPIFTTIVPPLKINNEINSETGIYKNYYLGLINDQGKMIGGNGCYDDKGEFIILINNKNATNPTYSQLLNFLKTDTTDNFPYISMPSILGSYYNSAESYVNLKRVKDIIDGSQNPINPKECGDFAERLHNNAEKNGIRCGYVSIDLKGGTYGTYNFKTGENKIYTIPNSNHALNIFETIDKGLIYIDCTGMKENEQHPSNMDKIIDLEESKNYIPKSLFPEVGWNDTWENVGIIENIYITWDGEWNK